MAIHNHDATHTATGIGAYMEYLLRYVNYPVTAGDLKKKAYDKKFKRLAHYLELIPQDTVYQCSQEVLEHFGHVVT